MSCDFCEILEGSTRRDILFQNSQCAAFLSRDAVNEGHLLVVPKEHVSRFNDLSSEQASELMQLAHKSVKCVNKAFRPEGTTLGINSGVSQSIDHLHLHVVPRYENDILEDGDGFIEVTELLEKLGEKVDKQVRETTAKERNKTFSKLEKALKD